MESEAVLVLSWLRALNRLAVRLADGKHGTSVCCRLATSLLIIAKEFYCPGMYRSGGPVFSRNS